MFVSNVSDVSNVSPVLVVAMEVGRSEEGVLDCLMRASRLCREDTTGGGEKQAFFVVGSSSLGDFGRNMKLSEILCCSDGSRISSSFTLKEGALENRIH